MRQGNTPAFCSPAMTLTVHLGAAVIHSHSCCHMQYTAAALQTALHKGTLRCHSFQQQLLHACRRGCAGPLDWACKLPDTDGGGLLSDRPCVFPALQPSAMGRAKVEYSLPFRSPPLPPPSPPPPPPHPPNPNSALLLTCCPIEAPCVQVSTCLT